MTTERQKLFERIMKMYRTAQSLLEAGNEAEAMSFMDGVQKTLIANNLEMSDVEFAVMQKEEPIKVHDVNLHVFGMGKKKMIKWQALVAAWTAEAHMCGIMLMGKGTNGFWLVGRRQDRMVAEFMIVTLLRLCEKAADDAYVKHFYKMRDEEGDATLARGFRKAFIEGFAHRICHRYKKLIDETEAVAKGGTGSSLIRLSQEKALVQQVIDKLSAGNEGHDVNPKPRMDTNLDGYVQGAMKADQVNLKGTGLAAGQAVSKVLGQGQKLIGGG